MRVVAAILGLLLLAGCSDRKRTNPFDPKNPDTRGAPSGFVALAGDGRTDLRWDAVPTEGLLGFHLYRRTPSDTGFVSLSAILPPTTTSYADLGLLNGLDHRYRLFFVFERDGERGPFAEDIATPGSARPWVVDGNLGLLFRLTPDGRRVVRSYGEFDGPRAVAIDSARGHVWVSDGLMGRVTILDPATDVRVSIPGVGSPGTLAVDPLDHVTWVCDESGDRVLAFDGSGNPVGTVIEPVSLPLGIALDVFDRSVLVVERAASRMRRFAPDHSLLAAIGVDRPSRVAIDSLTRRAWVTSFEAGTVTRIPPSMSTIELTIPGFQRPIGVAVDSRLGRIWVADPAAGELVALDRGGAILFRVGGLTEVREVAVDPETGDVWATAWRTVGESEVFHLSSAGQVLSRLGGFSQPLGIAIDPGRR